MLHARHEWRRRPSLIALALVLAACGGGGGDAPPTPPPTPGTLATALSSTSGTVTSSGTVNTTLTATRGGSFTGTVTLTAEGAPNGVTVGFTPPTLASGNSSSELAITVSASTAPGTYPLMVRATGTGVTAATSTYTLTVNAPPTPDFTVNVSPGSLSIEQGQQGSATITLARTGGFTGDIGLFIAGVPDGVQVQLTPAITAGTTSALGVTVALDAAPGTYALVINATESGPRVRTAPLTLIVTAKPSAGSLTLAPSTIAVTQGQASAPITVTLVRPTGVTGDATFTLENVPQFVTGTFTPNPTGGTSSTLTLTVGVLHPPGTITIRVRATIGTTTSTANLVLNTNLFVPPDFALSVVPSVTALTAGASTSAAVTITRLANYTGAVSFAVSGVPAGVTATVAPSPTTSNTVTLAVTATAGAVPGVYPIVITGTGVGVSGSRSATLTLTLNAPAGGGNVQWRFCTPSRVPKWFGVRSGTSGAWTVVAPGANNTYAFPFPANGQVAYVQETSTLSFSVTVHHLTPQEALEAAAQECVANVPTKTVNGTVTGVAEPRSAIITMGGGSFAKVDAPQTAFTLTGVPDRPTDLIAFRGFGAIGEFGSYERVIIRRNLNPANGSTLAPLDFAGTEWIPGASRNSFWSGFGSDPFAVSTALITANGLAGVYHFSAPSLADQRSIPGFPESAREATDLFMVIGATDNEAAGRQLVTYARDLLPGGLRTFGPLLTPPALTILGSAPVRLRMQAPWQPEYNALASVTYVQSGLITRSVTLSGSASYFSGSGFTLEIPEFTGASGWNPAWMLQAGTITGLQVSATGIVAGGSGLTPVDGLEVRSAQRRGTVTP
jgi:hypothetical protein